MMSRASVRSDSLGVMKELRQMRPDWKKSLETSATRRMFSSRSASLKAEALVQAVAQVVAIQKRGGEAVHEKPLLQGRGQRAFAGTGEAEEPDDLGMLAQLGLPLRAG